MRQRPLLVHSHLTDRCYIVTRYTRDAAGNVTASEKFDCTNELRALIAEWPDLLSDDHA